MNWDTLFNGYKAWIFLERKLSKNTLSAYLSDLESFKKYILNSDSPVMAQEVKRDHITAYLAFLKTSGISTTSQARIISSLRSFYRYLHIEKITKDNPATEIDLPGLGRHLPEVLSIDEVNNIFAIIDLSSKTGERDKAILETLYGCGLRVSELINLTISGIFFKEEYIKVTGKGDKERLVPLGHSAANQISRYINFCRTEIKIKPGYEDFVFISRQGKALSRVSVYNIVKAYAEKAGIKKTISPHTFRHTYATHLIENGANLRAVQQMLGHTSITTTEIYTHLSTQYLRDAILKYHPREK